MTYLSWAVLHEGNSDALYFGVLIPRLMEAIIIADGIRHSDIPLTPAIYLGRSGKAVDDVAVELCGAKDAFELVFIHADVGGRGQERRLAERSTTYCARAFERCAWPPVRCVTVTPKHETEAWVLADPEAVMDALGYRGTPADIGLPNDAQEAERLVDPKRSLASALRAVSGVRRQLARIDQLFPRIAQHQSFDKLRGLRSFRNFEVRLRASLADLGCIARE
jgi:hypothetical protein